MLRLCLPILFLFSFPAHGEDTPFQPDSLWLLAYSVEDEFCQHMLGRLNEDLMEDGSMSPEDYPEVGAIEWKADHKILDPFGENLLSEWEPTKRTIVAIADANNDGEPEILHLDETDNFHQGRYVSPSFRFFDMSLKDQIFDIGISIRELNQAALGDYFFLEEGREKPFGGYFGLMNLPNQSVYRYEINGKKYSQDEPVSLSLSRDVYPLIYDEVFYILTIGNRVDFHEEAFFSEELHKNLTVIRSYSPENKVSDTCYFIRHST